MASALMLLLIANAGAPLSRGVDRKLADGCFHTNHLAAKVLCDLHRLLGTEYEKSKN